jgi:hypothetical protein
MINFLLYYVMLLVDADMPSKSKQILHIDAGRGPGGNASLGCHRHLQAA